MALDPGRRHLFARRLLRVHGNGRNAHDHDCDDDHGRGARRHGQGLVKLQDAEREHEPDNRQRDVARREPADLQVQRRRAHIDDDGRQDIAAAREEGIDRLFRLVLLFPRGRQPEQLTRRIHDRIVGRIFGSLDPANEAEAGAGGNRRITAERNQRQREQRAAQAGVLDEARDDERLQQKRHHVHPELIAAGKRAEIRLLVEARVRSGERGGVPGQEARDQVLARRVHDVQQNDEHRDRPQIRASEDQLKPAGRRQRRLRPRVPRLTRIDDQVQPERHRQQDRRNLDDRLRGETEAEEMAGDVRSDRSARRHSDHDHRKEPVARRLVVDVVGVRPELRDERVVEDADPDEEGHADKRRVRRDGEREELDVDHEKERHADEELHTIDFRREPAVRRHEPHQQNCLAGRRVRADFGTSAHENQRLADGLDDRIADQQEEDVEEHQRRRRTFARADVGEERQDAVEQRLLVGWRTICGCRHMRDNSVRERPEPSRPPVTLARTVSGDR